MKVTDEWMMFFVGMNHLLHIPQNSENPVVFATGFLFFVKIRNSNIFFPNQ